MHGASATSGTHEIDGLSVFVQGNAPGSDEVPVLYLHGVPTTSDDWLPFLARTGGIAPDLPGFGRSAKRGDFDYSIAGYDRFLERFLDSLGVERVKLVMHDWGSVGLSFAQRLPERIDRIVVMDVVPFLPGYRWHVVARLWRTPIVGELLMGSSSKWASRRLMPPTARHLVDEFWPYFDQGTQRAILRLYRSAPSEVLAAAGAHLSELDVPALVVWGDRDPYIPTSFAEAFAATLPRAELVVSPRAGHWPWLDDPSLVDRVVAFLNSGG
jgi:pimeloyl-ACP methyl ester carboxylesterase